MLSICIDYEAIVKYRPSFQEILLVQELREQTIPLKPKQSNVGRYQNYHTALKSPSTTSIKRAKSFPSLIDNLQRLNDSKGAKDQAIPRKTTQRNAIVKLILFSKQRG